MLLEAAAAGRMLAFLDAAACTVAVKRRASRAKECRGCMRCLNDLTAANEVRILRDATAAMAKVLQAAAAAMKGRSAKVKILQAAAAAMKDRSENL